MKKVFRSDNNNRFILKVDKTVGWIKMSESSRIILGLCIAIVFLAMIAGYANFILAQQITEISSIILLLLIDFSIVVIIGYSLKMLSKI